MVVGYGRIIPKWMLDLPRLGNINLHASILPKYRGAAPIQWAIASGELVTGVTTTTFTDTAVTAATTYYYTVTAVNGNTSIVPAVPSESAASGESSATTAPLAPTNLSALAD